MSFSDAAIGMFDPRGRCDRKGLLVIALVLLVLQALAGLLYWLGIVQDGGPAMRIAEVMLVLMAFAATSKRLHDIGLSAWWLLAGLGGMIVWSVVLAVALVLSVGATALQPGSSGFATAIAGTMLPAFVVTLWLHLAKGEAGDNRFGPAPELLGFSARPRPVAAAATFGSTVRSSRT